MSFVLHPQLAKDTFPVTRLELCEVRLQDNALFPWLVLVPALPGLREIIDLSENDRTLLMRELSLASTVLQSLYKPDKLNIAALGNVVPQLHVHVIARFRNDAAWDKPVWGQNRKPYAAATRDEILQRLARTFNS